MDDFNVGDFVATIESLGLKLGAVPLADGTVRLTRWRMPHAVANADKIDSLWATRIGEDSARLEQLASHVMQRTDRESI